MTKETKIGLLVGLAFIILFAIILSEKAPSPKDVAPPAFTVADATSESEVSTGRAEPLSDAGRLPVESQLSPIVEVKRETQVAGPYMDEEVGRPIPQPGDPIPPLPESVVSLLNTEPANQAGRDAVRSEEPVAGADSSHDAAPVALEDAVASAIQASEPTEDVSRPVQMNTPEPVQDNRVSHLDTARPEPIETRPPAPAKPVRILAVHTVEPGESLGKIAAKHYGRATPQRIRAIFEANRDVLKSVHVIRANDKLRIPELDSANEQFEPAPEFAAADIAARRESWKDQEVRIPIPVGDGRRERVASNAAAVPRDSASPQYRWYEVRKNDTLSKIARQELGDEGLYRTIYKLNRDNISAPDKIKPGMKIRLPVSVVSNRSPGVSFASSGEFTSVEP